MNINGHEMASPQLSEDICRICLEHDVILNWKELMFEVAKISYKDCYYKYTQLQENDSDPFPTNLCHMCANELKNAHLLFEKALESVKILQVGRNAKQLESESYLDISVDLMEIKPQIQPLDCMLLKEIPTFGSPTGDEALIKIEDGKTDLALAENDEDKSNFSSSEYKTIESGHFIDIQNSEKSFEQKFLKKTVNKMKKRCDSSELTVSNASKLEEIEESSAKTVVEQESSSSQNIKTSTTNKTGRRKILMCAYCSLKVAGTNQLKKHEATHNEDRKRTETCPQCGIKLYTKMALNNHMQIHDENRQKRYKCEFCEKAFFNRGALNVHKRIHLGLMVKCPLCSKEFYRQIDVDRHLPKHSATPLQKTPQQKLKYTVQCQNCNENVRIDRWKEHKAAHLGQPQVKCKICDKNFFARSKCVRHIQRTHKKKIEYEEFIHYYADGKTRISHLIIKQQEIVKPLTPTT